MPHDVPTAAQLIESVREWLEKDVLTSTTGRVQFHSRVAINVLAMVERELAMGGQQALDHAARLSVLGMSDDAELATAIRNGDLDDRFNEVVELVRASVLDKLAVANPSYALPTLNDCLFRTTDLNRLTSSQLTACRSNISTAIATNSCVCSHAN